MGKPRDLRSTLISSKVIHSMILFRARQGALGASMIPIVFTSSLYYFQGPRRVYSAAVVGTIASLAPTLGPIIGGWITDAWNWHYGPKRHRRKPAA